MSSAAAEIVGRSEELALVSTVLSLHPGSPRALLFRGEAGIGKTALLDHAVASARAEGFEIVTVRGAEYQSDIAFSGLNQLAVALAPHAGALTSAQRAALDVVYGARGEETPNRLAVFSAVLALVSAAADTRRVLICVDDQQWVDRVSVEGLSFLAERLTALPACLIATERSSLGAEEARAGTLVRSIEPLEDAAAERLLRERYPSLGERARQRLLLEAEGNALALIELAPVLSTLAAGSGELSSALPLTRRLQGVFAARAQELPAATRDLLLVAALEGTGDLGVLRRATGDPALAALAPAEDAGIVRIEDAWLLSFRHPLTRSAIAEDCTGSARRDAHRRLAGALADDVDRCARHLAAATIEPDEAVAVVLETAARRAALRGVDGDDTAMRLLIRAADLSVDTAARRRRMAEASYIAVHRPGANAASVAVEELHADASGGEEELYAIATRIFLGLENGGALDPMRRIVIDAIDAAVARGDTASGGFIAVCEALFAIAALAEERTSSERFEAVLNLMPADGPAQHLQIARAMLDPAPYYSTLDPLLESASHGERELTVAELVPIASSALYLDRLQRFRPRLEQIVRDETASRGDARIRSLLSSEAFLSGRWEAEERLIDEGLALSGGNADSPWVATFVTQRAILAALRGDGPTARALGDTVLSGALQRGYGAMAHAAHFALLQDALARDDDAAAFEHAAALSPPGTIARSVPLSLWVFFDLVAAAVRLGRIDEARRHVTAIEEMGVPGFSPRYRLMHAACLAMLDDRAAGSSEILGPALEAPGLESWPFDLARIRLLQASFLRAAGRDAAARALARRCQPALIALKAQPWIERAAELAAAPVVAARDRVSGLTETERRVALLAAQGLTNKQIGAELFLSDRTVATHLYRTFPKLGITRRAALRDAISRFGIEAPVTV